MLKIRLQRVGRKHDPSFRVVVTDSTRGPKSGNFVDIVGSYDPRQESNTQLNTEQIQKWISQGAQVSDTVHNLLVTHKVIEGEKVNVLPRKQPIVTEDTQTEEKTEEKEDTVSESEEDASTDEVSEPGAEEQEEQSEEKEESGEAAAPSAEEEGGGTSEESEAPKEEVEEAKK